MLQKLYRYYANKGKRYYEENTNARVFVSFFMSLLIVLIAYTIFYLTREGLLQTQEEVDDFVVKVAPLFLYQVFLLIIGFLIFVSTSIFTLFNFFKGENDSWFMASPKFNELYWINFVKALLSSSWVIAVMAIPLLLAIQSVFNLTLVSFLVALFVFLLFTFVSSASAVVLVFLSAFVAKIIKQNSFVLISFLTGAFTIFYGVLIWMRTISVDLQELFQVHQTAEPVLDSMVENFYIFHSYYAAMAIFNLQQGDFSGSLEYLAVIFLLVVIILALLLLLKRSFLSIWQSFQEGSFEAKGVSLKNKKVFSLNRFPSSAEKVIFRKEFLTGIRSAKNSFWFLFLMFLLVLQVGVIVLVERYADSSEELFQHFMPALQLGILLYFLSAIMLRFVFPSFSQEGSTSWLVGTAPIDLKKVFYAKFRFFSTMIAFVGIFVMLLYTLFLDVDVMLILPLLLASVVAILTLTMLALSLGTIYANFETDDPHVLSTSAAGIIFTVLSLSYSVLGSYAIYLFFADSNVLMPMVFLLISVLVCIVMSNAAFRSLRDMEYY